MFLIDFPPSNDEKDDETECIVEVIFDFEYKYFVLLHHNHTFRDMRRWYGNLIKIAAILFI